MQSQSITPRRSYQWWRTKGGWGWVGVGGGGWGWQRDGGRGGGRGGKGWNCVKKCPFLLFLFVGWSDQFLAHGYRPAHWKWTWHIYVYWYTVKPCTPSTTSEVYWENPDPTPLLTKQSNSNQPSPFSNPASLNNFSGLFGSTRIILHVAYLFTWKLTTDVYMA